MSWAVSKDVGEELAYCGRQNFRWNRISTCRLDGVLYVRGRYLHPRNGQLQVVCRYECVDCVSDPYPPTGVNRQEGPSGKAGAGLTRLCVRGIVPAGPDRLTHTQKPESCAETKGWVAI